MHRLDRAFDWILHALALLAAAIFGLTAVLISVNVVLRNLGMPTIYGLLDAVEFGLLGATFLGAPWVLSKGAHVSVDLITGVVAERSRRRLARLTAGVGLVVSAITAFYGAEATIVSAGRGSMIRTAFTIPEWWILAIVPVAFTILALEFLRQAIRPPTAPAGAPEL
jgi:TRAP-type C4-dicarboxylate transport system permease small subunit